MSARAFAATSDVTLRAAEPRRGFPPEVAYSLAGFQVLCAESAVRIIAENEGKVVGMIFAEADAEQGAGLIVTVDVDPAHRRRGVGTQLMDEAEKQLQALGMRQVLLHFYTPHGEALRLYRGRGYVLKGKLSSYYGPGRDALLMVKTLG
jgi:ribosomal protein S18 acetylase RimI-like enzyme